MGIQDSATNLYIWNDMNEVSPRIGAKCWPACECDDADLGSHPYSTVQKLLYRKTLSIMADGRTVTSTTSTECSS